MTDFLWINLFRRKKKSDSLNSKLKENFLFQDLSLGELRMLEQIVHVRNYRPGETIFKQGELGVGMYIIMKGRVNIYSEEIEAISSETKTHLVTQLQQDDFLGDLALVEENSRRSATAVAQEDSTLIGFFKPDLVEVTKRKPGAGVKILFRLAEVLGGRLRETT
ncbi:MAG: cyclic nucleotide-binding domain-containing protein, partial [Bdellovibrio sp.]